MIDFQAIAHRKEDAARRLKAALYGIRKQNIPRLDQSILEKLANCTTSSVAYHADRDALLPHGSPTRSRPRHKSKTAILFVEAHRAVVLYWELIRTDEVVGLDRLINRLEYYAAHGTRACVILGGPDGGYSLLLPPGRGD